MLNASRLLSLVLRHHPEKICISLDECGWTSVDKLLSALAAYGKPLTLLELKDVVQNNDKKRFSFNGDMSKIKANQGHSVKVDLGLKAIKPPSVLCHGTVDSVLHSIRDNGLLKITRHHVHLSADSDTAAKVGGRRHGDVVILYIDAKMMFSDGYKFYQSENGVWLTDHVPFKYIKNVVRAVNLKWKCEHESE